MENYYQNNLETGKLNIYTSKEYYTALDNSVQKVFRDYCLFSRHQDCWISKGKFQNCGYLTDKLNELGFIEKPAVGEKISFEEQVQRQMESAKHRAERAEKRAEKAEKNSDHLSGTTNIEKMVQESKKATYYSRKAQTAKATAKGEQYNDERFLLRRIKESESIIRVCERKKSGRYNPGSPIEPISDEMKAVYDKNIAEQRDKLDFYFKCMKAIDPNWTPEQKASRKKGKGL